MIRDIKPQWARFVKEYWIWAEERTNNPDFPSMWDILQRDYGARRVYPMNDRRWSHLHFSDESLYTAFLLRWA